MAVRASTPKEPRSSRASADVFPGALDTTDAKLLELVQKEGRITLSELGRRISLSPAAVSDRLRRLEEGGVITGWGAHVAPDRLGYGILAFVRLAQYESVRFRDPRLVELAERPEVLEAHHLIGEEGWIFKVAVRDTAHLETLLEAMASLGRTSTSVVLSTAASHQAIAPVSPGVH